MVASWNTQAFSHAPVNNVGEELCSSCSGPYSSDELQFLVAVCQRVSDLLDSIAYTPLGLSLFFEK